MNKKILGIIAMMLVTVMALSSCAVINKVVDFVQGIISPAVELDDKALEGETLIDFANGANPDVLFESDGWSNGDVFNVVWKQHNVYYENGIMRLGITEEKASAWLNDAEVEFNYTAGEARTQNYYHYGDYEVSMKPSANPGTASTFFVCTGPYDLKDGVPNAHDEIDIEFLGNDTTHVQFNFFVDGKGGNEYMYDLGFDASEEFHTYGFRWTEDSITWFVDGAPVYKVTTDTSAKEAGNLRIVEKLPSTAGRILTNYWCGNERAWGWMGQYIGSIKDQGTEYQWMKTSAVGAPLNPPVDNPPAGGEDVELDWSAIAPIAPEFPSADPYVVTVDGNKANVTYTDVSGSAYMPIELDVTDAVAGKNYVYMKVTNNGSETVNVRVNMFDPTLTGNNKATNISATMNGTAVRTDLDWGGSFFDIPAGESAELVVCFGVGGVKLQLMIDSSRNDAVLRSGNITVEDIKFATVGEVETPEEPKPDEPKPDEPKPEDPTSGNLTLNFGDYSTEIGGNVTDGYGVTVDENNNINVVYTNIVGNSYKNFWANVASVAGSKNIFSVKVTNNGEATVKLRIDIESQTQINANTTCCNISATKNGVEVYTDHEWGGSTFEIAAGETATLEVIYDASKLPTNFKIMVDSCQWDDSTSHEGSITLSELTFSGEYTPEGGETPEEPKPDEPKPDEPKPDEPTPDAGHQFNFWVSSSDYVTNGNNIKYNGAGNSYSCAGTDIAALAAGKNTFTVTITNNGTADSRVRIDIQGTTKVGNHTVLNTGATGGDVWTDAEWGGSTVTVAAGQSVTLVITYDEYTDRGAVTNLVVFVDSGRGDANTYSADVTLSGMAFSGESVKPEEPKPEEPKVDPIVNISNLAAGTTEGGELIAGTGISASAGLSIDANKKSIDGFDFTLRLKLGGTMKVEGDAVAAGVEVVTNGAAKIVLYAISSSSSDSTRTLQLATLVEGAFNKLSETAGVPGDAIAKFEFEVSEAGTYYIGSTKSGINIYYIAVEYTAAEEPKPEEPAPVVGEYLLFAGNDCYTFDRENYLESHNITYTNVSDNTYQNVNAWIQDKAAGKTTLGVTIKNNGTETVSITVKLENSTGGAAETKVVIAAGESATASLGYDFAPDLVYLFIDSGWCETTSAHAGDITISGINFK